MMTEIPYYNAREAGYESSIKSQGSLGTCWALSAVSALEAQIEASSRIELSADHMSLANDFVIGQEEGGDQNMIMAYLSAWQGPVPEEVDPYGDGVTVTDAEPVLHVQEMQLLNGADAEAFKEAVMTYGSVQTSLCMTKNMTMEGQPYYNAETCAFADYEKEKVNHDVLIIGWDDSFPRERFSEQPGQDGAWICQNTWGADFGDDGIFYVSYEDANIAENGLVYSMVEDVGNYDNLYQWDTCGWQGRIGYNAETCWFANVYEAQEDEQLQAVGFYATEPGTSWQVYVAADEPFTDGVGDLQGTMPAAEGQAEYAGYYTVPLDEAVPLSKGESFAVIVRITTEGASKPAAVEMRKDSFTQGVTTEGKTGFISADGTVWENAEKVYGVNVCLKAYTDKASDADNISDTDSSR